MITEICSGSDRIFAEQLVADMGGRKVLVWVFTAIYFLIFHFIINFVINNFVNMGFAGQSFLVIFCWIIAFFASVGLAEFTEKRLLKIIRKNDLIK